MPPVSKTPIFRRPARPETQPSSRLMPALRRAQDHNPSLAGSDGVLVPSDDPVRDGGVFRPPARHRPTTAAPSLGTAIERHDSAQRQLASFVQHYVRSGFDAVWAARKAGYPNPATDGPELLERTDVIDAIGLWSRAQFSYLDLTPQRVMAELAAIVTHDPADAYDETGNVKPIHDMPPAVRRSVKSYRQTSEGREVVLHDKVKAISVAASVLGLNKSNVDVRVSGQVGISGRINIDVVSDQELLSTIDAIEAEVVSNDE